MQATSPQNQKYPFSYSELCHFRSLQDLEKNAEADLGPIANGTFSDFVSKMKEIALKKGIRHPELFVGIQYNDLRRKRDILLMDAHREPSKHIWDQSIHNFRLYCPKMPHVYVLDRDKYQMEAKL